MAKKRSVGRFIFWSLIFTTLSAMTVVAETSVMGNIFISAKEFFGVSASASSAANTSENTHVDVRYTDNSAALSNGPIIFQRGFLGPFDFPFNRNATMYKLDPATGTETVFGSGSQPSYSADGSKVVFNLQAQIERTSATAYNPVGLTILGGGSAITGFAPKWSPDGGSIAYNQSQSINSQLYYHVKVIEGSCTACDIGPELNPTSAVTDLYPSWHPLMTSFGGVRTGRILMVETGALKSSIDNGDFYSGDVFSEFINIAADGTVTGGAKVNLTNSPAQYGFPVFSHDGALIAYVRKALDGTRRVIVANADGSNAISAILYPSDAPGSPQNLVWSPDDARIAFSDGNQLHQVLLSTLQVTDLTSGSASGDLWPSWAPGTATPTPTPTPTPTTLAANLVFSGSLRDRVNRSDAGVTPDGDADGTFSLTLPPAAANKSFKSIVLVGPNGNEWDTIPQQSPPLPLSAVKWVVGLSETLDGQLFNCSDGSLTCTQIPVGNAGTFDLFVPDSIPSSFTSGKAFTVTVTFVDGTTATGTTTVGSTPAVDLTLSNLTASPNSAAEGQDIEYHMTIKNNGTLISTGVTLQNGLVTFEGFNGGFKTKQDGSVGSSVCQEVDTNEGTVRTVKCAIGTILPGESIPVSVHLRFQRANAAGVGFAEFAVFSGQFDLSNSDNTTSGSVTVVGSPRPPNDDVDVVFKNFFTPGKVCGGNGGQCDSGVLPGNASGSVTGKNVGATRQDNLAPGNPLLKTFPLGEPNHVGAIIGGRSVWYAWQATARGTVTFSTGSLTGSCNAQVSVCTTFDSLLAVYTILPDGTISKVGEDDDAPGVTNGYSTISFDSKATTDTPTIYFIVVDGYKGATGNIDLSWNLAPIQPRQVSSAITGITPGATCSNNSDFSDVCNRDANGNFQVTVKGKGFTSDSRVFVNGNRDVQTDLINGNLVSHISPSISLTEITKPGAITVRTRIGPAPVTGPAGALRPEALSLFEIAKNIGQLNVFELHNFVIPPNTRQEVCIGLQGNKDDDETCIIFNNLGPTNMIVTPTVFAGVAECVANHGGSFDDFVTCQHNIPAENFQDNPYAINPANPADANSVVTIKKKGSILPGTQALIASGQAFPRFLVQGGTIGLISQDGNSLVTAGGGLIGQDGNGLIGQDGNGLIGQDGNGVISNDGGTLIGQDGNGRAEFIGAPATDPDYDARAAPLAFSSLDSISGHNRPISALASNDLSKGAGGQFIASSSGGAAPTFTISTDPVTGEAVGTITMTFDNTSNPRVTNLQGLAFGVSLNPTVIQLASSSVTVNEGDGHAAVTLTRSGDTTNTVTVSYATSDGTANMRTDYSPVYGSVTFAPGDVQKTVNIPLIDNGYGPSSGAQRAFNLVIGDTVGGAIQMPNTATITITNNDAADLPTNPLDDPNQQFFIRQQYLDLLGREPTANELASVVAAITQCGTDNACVRAKHTDLSYSLFMQYEQGSAYVFALYRAAYGNQQPFPNPDPANLTEAAKWPAYAAFVRDRVSLVDGADFAASQLALANAFVNRTEFRTKYAVTAFPDGPSFVDAVLTTIRNDSGVDLTSQRDALITVFNQAGGFTAGRGAVLYRLAGESQTNPVINGSFVDAEYNRAFAATMYFAYLKSDGDLAGLNARKGQLDAAPLRDATAQRILIDVFVNSTEYRVRFGLSAIPAVTVSGRVLTSDGKGLRNAVVSLTDPNGAIRKVLTNSFGFYSFDSVPKGTCTFRVTSKLFRFTPRTLQIADNIASLDFTGLE